MFYERNFIVGESYLTQNGRLVTIIADNVGTLSDAYRCVQGSDGGWRYDREGDVGRVTGSAHDDDAHPLNLVAGSKQ